MNDIMRLPIVGGVLASRVARMAKRYVGIVDVQCVEVAPRRAVIHSTYYIAATTRNAEQYCFTMSVHPFATDHEIGLELYKVLG